VEAIDASPDMIGIAASTKLSSITEETKLVSFNGDTEVVRGTGVWFSPEGVRLRKGDIFNLDLADKSVDVTFAIRIFNLISPDDMKLALKELQRVTRNKIVFNLRVWEDGTKYKRAQKIETLRSALDGWKIARDRPIHMKDFRLYELEPVA
jgi:hypothetical protein